MGKKSQPAAPAVPDYAAAATAQGAANLDAARIGAELTNTNQVTPYGSQTFTRDPGGSDQWTSTISFSPEQQALYDRQTQGQLALANTGTGMLGRVQDAFAQPVDTSQFPTRVNSVDGANYNMYSGPTDAAVSSVDMSKLDGGQVRDALYRKATAQLDPQYKQAEDDMRTRLLNSGVREGSEAFTREMNNFNQQRQTDYGDARDRSILAEGSERSRMLAEMLGGAGFANDAQQQTIGNRMAATGMNNQVASQGLQDRIAQGNFANTQRGAAIDEAAYLRSLPLNEYTALTSGSQVTNPSFRGTGQVQGPAAAPVFAGAQAQGQSAIDLYNTQMASANSAQGGAAGLFGTAITTAGTLF